MEQKFSNFGSVMEAENHSKNSAMDTETISKNGKNPVSEGIWKLLILFLSC